MPVKDVATVKAASQREAALAAFDERKCQEIAGLVSALMRMREERQGVLVDAELSTLLASAHALRQSAKPSRRARIDEILGGKTAP